MECIRQRHFAVAVMMSVGLAIGCDMNELWPVASIGEAAFQAVGKLLAAVQQLFESYGLRDWAIVEKKIDLSPGRQLGEVGAGGIDASAAHVFPASSANLARLAGLARRQDGELDSLLRQDVQRFQI